jgi:hypothetical protein
MESAPKKFAPKHDHEKYAPSAATVKREGQRTRAAKEKLHPTPTDSAPTKASVVAEGTSRITLPPLETRKIQVRLVGVTPLIVHRWSVKAREMMLNKQTKKAVNKKELRNPEADYRDSLYMESFPDAKIDESLYQCERSGNKILIPCFPSIGFKGAAVAACTSVSGVTKVAARQCFHIEGQYIPIEGHHRMREDMVRIGQGTADLRFRAEFPKWAVTLPLIYNINVLSKEQVVNLFNTAGFAVGIGEWRVECDGDYGRFQVDLDFDT